MSERVWEPYLTEQDRAHLDTTTPKEVGFGKRPALLLVDLYRWVFGDEPQPLLEAVKDWPGSCGLAAWDAIPHIQTLLDASRKAGVPVIHVTGLSGSGVESWSSLKQPAGNSDLREGAEDEAALDRQRRRFDIIDECGPIDGEAVLYKTAPSAFWGTPLTGHLTRLGIDTLITCGESTSGCVRASVVDGCTNRYRMIVVEECVFDRHEATHAINLFDIHQKYADVLPLAEVLERLAEGSFEKAGG